MTNEEIKKLKDLRYELEQEMGEEFARRGANTPKYDVLLGQMELLDGIYSLLNITEEQLRDAG